jgi:hypothetical protein
MWIAATGLLGRDVVSVEEIQNRAVQLNFTSFGEMFRYQAILVIFIEV